MEDVNQLLDEESLIELDGFITYYKFENEQNGYRIASFKIDDNKQERTITIVGYFPHFSKLDALSIKGKMIKHKKFGLQVEVTEIIKKLPTSKENIIRLLSSSNFKKIGKSAASRLYDYLGEEVITKLINSPEIYDELIANKVINSLQANYLQDGLRDFDFKSNAFQTLLSYGFSLKNIMKAEAVYGEELDKIIKDNPYQIINDIDGINFKSIDKLALNMGFEVDDPRRVKAAIIYVVLGLSYSTGNTYIYYIDIRRELNKLIIISDELFDNYLNELIEKRLIIKEDEKYFHYSLYKAENNIAKELKPFIKRKINTDRLKLSFDDMIKAIEMDEGIKYSIEQLDAIYGACSNGLYIITGGPGTGKTTILNAILKMLTMLYGEKVNIALCAPTGRASKRMSYLSGHYASTIHRLLKWDLHSNSFAYNQSNRLRTDVIIVDEFSMVDTLLFEALLVGTTGVSQIILIGDDAQLPSVGAGNLLYDLLHIDLIKKNYLSHIYRQNEGSNIVNLAHNIRYGILDESFRFNEDLSFLKIKNVQATQVIIDILSNLFNQGLSFDNIQIIVPMYANVAGIDNINAAIQDWYNPKSSDTIELRVGHQVFRENDRVLQLKNQPEDDIFNGDIGIIREIDLDNDEMLVEFDTGTVSYNKQTYANLTLAYAISIHKSQGSEFDVVIMCIFNDYGFMLNKQLIYTGVSRAKKSLIILGEYYTFIKKALIENKQIRQTNMIEAINKSIDM